MKVVINSYYGGFGLSTAAMEYIADRKGWDYQITDSYERWWEPPEDSPEYNVFGYQIWDVDLPRTDPDLVQCVETLGDKSWGRNAELKVVENFVIQESEEFEAFESEDTLSILNRYIEEAEISLDKSMIQKLIQEIYQEACELV